MTKRVGLSQLATLPMDVTRSRPIRVRKSGPDALEPWKRDPSSGEVTTISPVTAGEQIQLLRMNLAVIRINFQPEQRKKQRDWPFLTARGRHAHQHIGHLVRPQSCKHNALLAAHAAASEHHRFAIPIRPRRQIIEHARIAQVHIEKVRFFAIGIADCVVIRRNSARWI